MWHLLERAATGVRFKLAQTRIELRSEVDAAAARIGANMVHAIMRAAIWLSVLILLAIAAGFATVAGYHVLLHHLPEEEAEAIIAGGFAALALLIALVAVALGVASAKPAGDSAAQARTAPREGFAGPGATGAANPPTASAPSDAPVSLGAIELEHIADLLGQAGLRQEQAALMIASEVVKALTPTQLVAAGLAAGFIVGRRLDEERRNAKSGSAQGG